MAGNTVLTQLLSWVMVDELTWLTSRDSRVNDSDVTGSWSEHDVESSDVNVMYIAAPPAARAQVYVITLRYTTIDIHCRHRRHECDGGITTINQRYARPWWLRRYWSLPVVMEHFVAACVAAVPGLSDNLTGRWQYTIRVGVLKHVVRPRHSNQTLLLLYPLCAKLLSG